MLIGLFIGSGPLSLAMELEDKAINETPEQETRSLIARLKDYYGKPAIHAPIIILTTAAFSCGLYFLYNNYDPHVLSDFLSQTFFYDREIGMEPNGWQDDSEVPYSNCYDSYTNLPISFVPHVDSFNGPGYYTWLATSKPNVFDGVLNKGNLSDMIRTILHAGGCDNYDFWFNYATSVLDGAQFDPALVNCTANADNQTICCGSGWGFNTWPNWWPEEPDANFTMRMANGSGVCAQAQVHQEWQMNMGIFGALGALIPTSATVLAAWSRFRPTHEPL